MAVSQSVDAWSPVNHRGLHQGCQIAQCIIMIHDEDDDDLLTVFLLLLASTLSSSFIIIFAIINFVSFYSPSRYCVRGGVSRSQKSESPSAETQSFRRFSFSYASDLFVCLFVVALLPERVCDLSVLETARRCVRRIDWYSWMLILIVFPVRSPSECSVLSYRA